MLTSDIVIEDERQRFLTAVDLLPSLPPEGLHGLTVSIPPDRLVHNERKGIF